MPERRLDDLQRFYALLEKLEKNLSGCRKLKECHGRINWPKRGVYFFQESGETRTNTGEGLRIVRVGTHALTNSSQTTLWNRLSQHKGPAKSGGGNHRGSIFRLLVGTALTKDNPNEIPSWGKKNSPEEQDRENEEPLEKRVSEVIGEMPFLWLPIDDKPGPMSLRGLIERNSIALVSNLNKPRIDPPSKHWLGHNCERELVRNSGMWNQRHVDEEYDPDFLNTLETLVFKTETTA